MDSGERTKVSNLKVTLSCRGLTEFQALDLVLHASYFICVHFCKDLSGFTKDGRGGLEGKCIQVSRGAWQESGMVKRNGSGLGPSGFQPLLGHLVWDDGQEMKSLSHFVLIVTVGTY